MDRESLTPRNEAESRQYTASAAAVDQNSLYNLSLSDVQSQLAGGNLNNVKPLNLDTGLLLTNLISFGGSSGETHALPSSASSSTSPASFFLGNFDLNDSNIQSVIPPQLIDQNGDPNKCSMMSIDPVAGMVSHHYPTEWLHLQMAAALQQQQHQMAASSTVLDSNFSYENNGVYPDNSHLSITMPVPTMSTSSASNQAAAAAERRRRHSDEVKKKSIERRQKRMIKNRESAVRSRARKQAYTQKLGDEVDLLTERNKWLCKQKEVARLLSSEVTTKPKYQLRRTSSASF